MKIFSLTRIKSGIWRREGRGAKELRLRPLAASYAGVRRASAGVRVCRSLGGLQPSSLPVPVDRRRQPAAVLDPQVQLGKRTAPAGVENDAQRTGPAGVEKTTLF